MAIPDFQTMMLPILLSCQNGEPVRTSQLYSRIADHFNLTDAERSELLPSGRQERFKNRVAWAVAHLNRAGLLDRVESGTYKLTSAGVNVLISPPSKIDVHFLDQFPGHLEFRKPRTPTIDGEVAEVDVATQTPSEILEKAYLTLRKSLAGELLDKVQQASPSFFERLVVELLLEMGYGGSRKDAGSAIGRAGDGGIDGIIKEDKLGLDVIYIQPNGGRPQLGGRKSRRSRVAWRDTEQRKASS